MNRTSFYNISVVDDVSEFDHLYNSLSNFKTNYPISLYTISTKDLLRPDLISYSFYGTVDYWWIVCYINQIHNPFAELSVGRVIAMPSIMDVYEFSKKYRIR